MSWSFILKSVRREFSDEERGLSRDFLDNLKSYKDKGPELVNRGVVVDSGTRLRILRATMVGDDVVDDSETAIFIIGRLPFLSILMYESWRNTRKRSQRGMQYSPLKVAELPKKRNL